MFKQCNLVKEKCERNLVQSVHNPFNKYSRPENIEISSVISLQKIYYFLQQLMANGDLTPRSLDVP